MSDLLPCPSCRRHVRKHEPACPFCAAELALADLPAPVLPRARLGRAATFAFGATLAGAALVACGGDSEEGKKGGGGENAGGNAGASAGGNTTAGNAMGGNTTAGNTMGGNIAQPYGVPPIGGAGFGNFGGSGGQSAGAGGQTSAGNGGQGGTGIAPPYGIPPSEGGGTPVYGAAPAD